VANVCAFFFLCKNWRSMAHDQCMEMSKQSKRSATSPDRQHLPRVIAPLKPLEPPKKKKKIVTSVRIPLFFCLLPVRTMFSVVLFPFYLTCCSNKKLKTEKNKKHEQNNKTKLNSAVEFLFSHAPRRRRNMGKQRGQDRRWWV